MSLHQKALEMRNAIDAIELAMSSMGGFEDLARLWEGAADDVQVCAYMTAGQVRQFYAVYGELNRIINSPEFIPANLSE